MRRWLDYPWTLGVAVLALVGTAGALLPTEALFGGRLLEVLAALLAGDLEAVRAGEHWRLVTGPLVHGTWGHLVRDLAVFVVIGAVCEAPLRRVWPWMLGLALVVPTLTVLLTRPELGAYLGLSGAVNTLLVVGFAWALTGTGRPPWYVFALAGAYGVKLVYETATGALLMPMELGESVVAVPEAHLAGAVVGALVVAAVRLWPKLAPEAYASPSQ